MGGMHGEIYGKTKIEVWKKFEPLRSRDNQPLGLYLETPLTKKEAYRKMTRDPQTGQWVLWYHFGK